MLLVLGLVLSLGAPAAFAEVYPQVSLSLSRSSVAVGETVVVTVSLTGAADVYGSAVDLYYDPVLVEPKADSTVTSATGLVTQGMSESQYFATQLSGTEGLLSRQSLIAIRLGQVAGASGAGAIGTLEFVAKAAGTLPFQVSAPGGAAPIPNGRVNVSLVNAAGSSVSFTAGAVQTLTITNGTSIAITSPVSGAFIGTSTVSVAGTTSPSAAVTVTLDNSQSQSATADAAGAFSVSFTGVTDGNHSVVAATGTVSTSPVTFVVDLVDPVVTISPIATVTSPLTVAGSFTEANVDAVYLQVNPAGPNSYTEADRAQVNVASSSFAKTLTLQNGTNVIRATAVDKVGRKGVTEVSVNYASLMPYLRAQFDKTSYGPGETVNVDVYMESIPADLMGIAAEFRYDASRLTVVDVFYTGTILGGTGKQVVTIMDDPEIGTVLANITNPNGITAGKTKAFTIQFTVKGAPPEGQAFVNFSEVTGQTGGNGTAFTNLQNGPIADGNPISASAQVSLGGRVTGTAQLTGRATADYSGITVKVMNGTTEVATGTTQADGSFDIGQITPGTYSVRFTRAPYLTFDVTNVPISSGVTTSLSHLPIRLAPGNIVDNASSVDVVFLEDLGALATAWGSDTTNANGRWNAMADLDGNGAIFLSDLGLLATYWGKAGATQPNSNQVLPYVTP